MKLASAAPLALFAAVGLMASTQAAATVLTFEDLSVGAALSNQYAGQGVTFSPNAFTGAGGPTGPWATNTNLTIVSSTGSDIGGLGSPSLVSGNIVRSFNGWLSENGDPSLGAAFSTPVSSVGVDFAGVATPASVRLFVYDGLTLLHTVAGSTTGQIHLGYSAASITRVVITAGDFFDWVGFDNFSFTPIEQNVGTVPEPGPLALLAMGLGGVAALRRRRND